jgi:hypothetical protein
MKDQRKIVQFIARLVDDGHTKPNIVRLLKGTFRLSEKEIMPILADVMDCVQIRKDGR